MDTELALKEYGLTDKEIKVYLALLPLGKINLQEIAKRVDFPRTTVYNTLNYLFQKGLVSKIIKKGVTYFEATEPSKLVDNLDQRKKLIEKALPQLEGLKKVIKESSSTEIYEGTKGLFTILSDIFKVKQQVYYFGSYSLSVEVLKHQPEHFRTIRLERKIPAKIIIDKYDEESFHKPLYKKITEMRFLNSLKDFPCMIFIYGHKVALYTLKGDLVGIIIKNKEVSKSMKLIFDTYWSISKPVKL
jgi:HTH-type transcriptional regulator, sugar sensing transcriptional regulator